MGANTSRPSASGGTAPRPTPIEAGLRVLLGRVPVSPNAIKAWRDGEVRAPVRGPTLVRLR